jgi:hypothetical protein
MSSMFYRTYADTFLLYNVILRNLVKVKLQLCVVQSKIKLA